MKFKFVPILSLLFCLTGCKKYDSIQQISYDEMLAKIDNKETFIYYIGHDKCSYCAKLEKELTKMDNTLFYYVDFYSLGELRIMDELDKINQIVPDRYFSSQGYTMHNISLYTPSIYKYDNGNLIAGYVGNQTKEEVEEIKNFNFINMNFFENLDTLLNIYTSFDVMFYNDSSKDALKAFEAKNTELLNTNQKAFYLKYSSISGPQKGKIMDKYHETHEKPSDDFYLFKDLDYFWLTY